MREELIQPPNEDRWESEKEKVMEEEIQIICEHILEDGVKTDHQKIYDCIYELIEADVREYYDRRTL